MMRDWIEEHLNAQFAGKPKPDIQAPRDAALPSATMPFPAVANPDKERYGDGKPLFIPAPVKPKPKKRRWFRRSR